jgi:hypothetical protein
MEEESCRRAVVANQGTYGKEGLVFEIGSEKDIDLRCLNRIKIVNKS